MWRPLAESIGLFLLPFAAFALYLTLRARWPLAIEHWTRSRIATLVFLGLLAAFAGLAGASLFAPREQGVYVPPRVVNGVLEPGHFQ